MMVVAFLFYSGYGIREQYKKYGTVYLKGFIPKRIGLTWIHFVIALFLFTVTALILRNEYTLKQWMLCWIGLESIGNSNWFIFDILALYFVAYVSLSVSKGNERRSLYFIWTFSIILWAALWILKGGERWWYDTLLTFPLGFTYSLHKDRIELFMKRSANWILSFVITLVGFIVFYYFRNAVCISISSLLFAFLIVLLSMKFLVGNKVLTWLGARVFEIYILQRIPMIILQSLGVTEIFPFFVISAGITLLLALVFHVLFVALDDRLKMRLIK